MSFLAASQLRIMFTLFFFGEIVVKLRVFGYRDYLWGSEWYLDAQRKEALEDPFSDASGSNCSFFHRTID